MESDIEQQHHRQTNSGLSRYESAPSSYFTSLIDRKFCEQFVSRPSSPETERIFARFMTSGRAAEADQKTLYLAPTVKSEAADVSQASGLHQNQWKWKPPLPNLGRESSYSMEIGGGNCSLVRQSSSPAELLWQINVENGGNQGSVLARHLSLPYSKSGGLLQLSDSVPCKIRAKRGCATHPRSVAERVRRTRISERIRKLQELVPNMDKQANTSEMLDLAIEYIKSLQKQVQTLSNNHENCRCSNEQLPQY